MGYPLRWDELAAPQCEDEAREQIAEIAESQPQSLRRYFRRLVLVTSVGAALLALSVIGVSRLFLNDRQAPALQMESAPSGVEVSAAAPKVERRVGFVEVRGNLVNRTPASLDKVEAVVDLLDADRNTLSTQTAMVERDSIAPGQAANFQLEMADVPAAKAYRLRFKKLYGSELN